MKSRSKSRTWWQLRIPGSSRIGWLGSLAAIALLGCSSTLGPEEDAFEAALALWTGSAPSNYIYTLQRSCFCGPDFTRAIQIAVVDGAVVSAVYADDETPVDRPLSEIDTIADLFDEIRDAIDRDAFRLVAEYDDGHGYPTDVSIDYDVQIADEEMAFTVRDFDTLAVPLD